jgi:hypothetical protein
MAAALAGLVGGACSGSLAPLPLPADRAECAHCGMLISSEATGGQIVSVRDEPRFYDDIACLAADATRLESNTRAYVRTISGAWVNADDAGYARMQDGRTPMGSGIVAFDTADAAPAHAERSMTWQDVVAVQTSEAHR